MTLPALVLVHGGFHAGDCWALTIDAIKRLAPDLRVFPVDLPGRRSTPGDLRALTIADLVASVVAEIDNAGLDSVVIVGHSMAGLTVPGVTSAIGAGRVRELILAAACVPSAGASLVDVLSPPLAAVVRHHAKKGEPHTFPGPAARLLFLNGVPRTRRLFMQGRLYPESSRVMVEKVSRKALPDSVHRTWILTRRDRMHSPAVQLAGMKALGGVHTVAELETCHSLMVSEPELLADLLVARCRLYE